MRGVLPVLIAAWLGGCYDDPKGLTLVVYDDDNALHVASMKLFLAKGSSTVLDIAPDRARLNAERDYLHAAETLLLEAPSSADLIEIDGDRAVWNLQAGSDLSVKRIVVVGYDGQGTAVGITSLAGVDVPATGTLALVAHLTPARQIEPSDEPMPAGVRVWDWGDAAASCLGIEESNGANEPRRTWLVPARDLDCDSIAAELECRDDFYKFEDPGEPTYCAIPATGSTPCMVGEMLCKDGAPSNACTRTVPQVCLANGICDPDLCLFPAGCATAQDTSRVVCTQVISDAGQQCGPGSAGEGELDIDLASILPTCTEARLVPFPPEGQQLATSQPMAGGTLKVERVDGACTVHLSFQGTADVLGLGEPFLFVLDVKRSVDHVMVPLVVKMMAGECTTMDTVCELRASAAPEHLGTCQ